MDLKEIEVRNIEDIIKRIFNKEVITDIDIDITIGMLLIRMFISTFILTSLNATMY